MDKIVEIGNVIEELFTLEIVSIVSTALWGIIIVISCAVGIFFVTALIKGRGENKTSD